MKDNNRKNGIIVLIAIVAVSILASVLGFIRDSRAESAGAAVSEKTVDTASDASTAILKHMLSSSAASSKKNAPKHKSGKPYVARLFITGTIEESNQTYDQKWLLDTVDALKKDEDNKGIILFIDSPGGAVYQADELYLKLLDYGEKKPVYAYLASMAASGGYYIACSAKHIVANRNTLTGSIGVIAGQFLDITELMEKYGVKSETIHAGRNKNMGNLNEPVTDEQRQIMQSVADECYEQFTGIVAERRKLPKEKVLELADGRIYTAKQAKNNGLIDDVQPWEDMLISFFNAESEGNEYQVIDYKYEGSSSFYNYLWGMSGASLPFGKSASGLPEAVENVINPKVPYPAYLYEAGTAR